MKNIGKIGLPFLSQDDLLKWLKQYTETPASIYDNAMDAEYLKTHIGGGDHRLFDGGHDPLGAWEAVKNASDTDSFTQEIIGYISAMFKDMSTISGMPFFTIDNELYKNSSEWISGNIPGVSKDWIKDFLTYDSFELLSSSLGIIAVLFCLKKDDIEKVSEILGSLSIIALLTANPLMGIATIFITVYAFLIKKNNLDKEKFIKGMAYSSISCIIFSVLEFPILVELAIVMVVFKILGNSKSINYEIQKRLHELLNGQKELIPLMINNVNQYKNLNTTYEDALKDTQILKNISDTKLGKRDSILKLLDKMRQMN